MSDFKYSLTVKQQRDMVVAARQLVERAQEIMKQLPNNYILERKHADIQLMCKSLSDLLTSEIESLKEIYDSNI